MQRRTFIFKGSALAMGVSLCGIAKSSFAQTTTGMNAIAEIKKLRINSGAFTGGYVVAPMGMMNWYFANLGLLPIVQTLTASELDLYIRPYLDLYLHHLATDFSIRDIAFTDGIPTGPYMTVAQDSDDSYAATLLSLAARYLRASGNWAWWDANKATLKNMAYRNLAVAIKPNGLSSVFQAPRNATNSLGYLMDNCEVYRGLRDYAAILRERGETGDANYYDSFANGVATGISTLLFDTASSGFKVCDGDARATTDFYAGTTCQVFPQAFGLTELSAYYDKAWTYLNRVTPTWQDGRYDDYPWAVLGFVAAQRGQVTQAKAQLKMIEGKFATARALVTINELGFYQRTRNVLAGRKDV